MKSFKLFVASILFSSLLLPAIALGQDSDGDGMPDVHENQYWCLMANTVDSGVDYDSDGMTSLEEYQYDYFLDPCDEDTDDDIVGDGIEVSLGSDPLSGRVAPGAVEVGDDQPITTSTSHQTTPDVVHNSSEYALAWQDYRTYNYEIFFQRVAPNGDFIGSELRITNAANASYNPDLIWTGSEYGLAFDDQRDGNREIYFVRLAVDGSTVGLDSRITFNSGSSYIPTLAWTGSEFGLAWYDNDPGMNQIFFRRIAADGTTVGGQIQVTDAAYGAQRPDIVASPAGFGIAWSQWSSFLSFNIGFQLIGLDGSTASAPRLITYTSGQVNYPDLSWNGSEFGLVWNDDASGPQEVYFTRLDSDGDTLMPNLRLTNNSSNSYYPAVEWNGSKFGVAWHDYRDGNSEIYYATVSEEGERMSADVRLTHDPDVSQVPAICWGGPRFGIAWQENRAGNYDIYFTRILLDDDGDLIANTRENNFNCDSDDWDTDDDLMPDGFEAYAGQACGLLPTIPDASADNDGDSVTNLAEYEYETDPCDTDTDDEGLNDYLEIYVAGTDPNNIDTDGDDVDDAWEHFNTCLDPLVSDEDQDPDLDTIINLTEYILQSNPCDDDSDGDGMPDGWEYDRGLDPTNPADGIEDPDQDGMNNWLEYYFGTEPDLEDADGDGISDYDETFVYLTCPFQADSDGDGLPDGWEIDYDTDPLLDDANSDGDDDGFTNLEEYFFGTNPNIPGNDDDRDMLSNDVETNSRVWNGIQDPGSSPTSPDTDKGGELDGIEALLGRDPNDPANDVTWSDTINVSSSASANSMRPKILGDVNTAFVLYKQNSGSYARLAIQSTSTGTSWSDTTFINTASQSVSDYDIENTSDDTIWVFFAEGNTVKYRTKPKKGVWSSISNLTATNEVQELTSVMSSTDLPAVAWVDNDLGTRTIYYKKKKLIMWSSTETLYSSTGFINDLRMVLGEDGEVYIVWEESTGIYFMYYDGSSWSSEELIALSDYGDVDLFYHQDSRRLYMAYSRYTLPEGQDNVLLMYYENGIWSQPEKITPAVYSSQNPYFFEDAMGILHVSFVGETYGGLSGYLYTFMEDGKWLAPQIINPVYDWPNINPSVYACNNGKLVHVMDARLGSYYEIYASVLDYPDEDADSLDDRQEVLAGTDFMDPDTDDDGLSDYNEVITRETDPLDPDTDGDRIDDYAEVSTYSSDPNDADSDGGLELDGVEAEFGRDPSTAADDLGWSNTISEYFGYAPKIVVDSDDHFHAASFGTYPYRLMYNYYNGSAWDGATTVYESSYGTYGHQIAVAPDGEIYIVFQEDNVPSIGWSFDIKVMHKNISEGSWPAPVAITDGDTISEMSPTVAIDGNARPHLAYVSHEGSIDRIYHVQYDGDSWLTPQPIVEQGSVWTVQMNSDPDGNIHMIYTDPDVYYMVWDGATWSEPELVVGSQYDKYANMTVDLRGTPHVLVREWRSPYDAPIMSLSRLNGKWTNAQTITPDDNKEIMAHAIASAGHGVLHAAWKNEDGFHYSVYTNGKWSKPFLLRVDNPSFINWGMNIVSTSTGNLMFADNNWYQTWTALDSDLDGINNFTEFLQNTDWIDPDSDDDGLDDTEEAFLNCDPNSDDSDGDGVSDYDEITEGTDPNVMDTDMDMVPDGWEILYGTNPLVDDSDDDPDGDGFTNLQEFIYHLDPMTPEPAPQSSCQAPDYENGDSILVEFECSSHLAAVNLYVSFNGLPYLNMGGFGYSKSCADDDLSFYFDPFWDDGTYRFYTRATLTSVLTEDAPATPPDATTIFDTQGPAMLYVTDDGDYTEEDQAINAEAAASDVGPAGVAGYFYAVGDAAYPDPDFQSLSSWKWDADGDISRAFGSTVMAEGTAYYVTVKAIDNAGNESAPLSSNGIVVDISIPAVPAVTDDGTYTGYTDRFHATWTCGGDSVSGVVQYDYAIGSSAGATDVVGWTDNATLTEVTRFGLELEDGSSYFIGVRAVNGAGLTSVGWSDGILVDSRGPEIAWSSPAHREIVNDDMPPVDLPVSINFIDPGGAGIDWSSLEMVLDFSTVQSFSQDGDTVSFDALALDLGNHVVNVQVADLAGNGLNRNVIFVVEDPRRVIINPVYVEWAPGDGDVTFVADGGTGAYRWAATGGALDSFTGTEVVFTPGPEAGAYVVAVSDAKLVSAQATIIISGEVEVAPAVVRLSAGSAATFTASGGSGDFSWTVNGGSCVLSGDRDETCSYTAFESSGQYSVKAQAGSGESFTSRVIVTDPVGRAIVVVGGGLVDSNRQVEALNSLGHLAYETLLARGFEPDQIMYLNPDATQAYDGDGDGYADDVDGAPTPAALQAAILDWATADLGVDNPGVGPGVPLIIYMVDHGGDDSFLINFTAAGAGQEVTPTQLDSWIDAVQGGDTSNPNGVDVVVIYDACRSGSFLDEVGGGGSDRIVITSSASSESAYFGVSGTISFSQFFWQRVRTGATLKSAFNDAAAALATWATQTPWLDDNGSGTYAATGDGKDGDAADLFVVGADFVTGAVLPELTPRGDALLEGDSLDIYSGILYASSSEISAMFAILTPPGFSPPQSEGNFDTPWLEDEEGNPLPRVYLEYSSATGDWRRRLDSAELAELFTVNGRYTATLYAIDLAGRVTAAAEFSITVFGPDPYEDDDWWSSGSSVEVNSSSAQAHNFHDSGDRDWVKFSVAFGDTGYYSVYTENLADRCDTVIELYGYSVAGSTVVPIAFDDDSGQDGGGSSRIFMYLSEGLYYAEVYQYGDTIGGQDTEYDLRVDHDEGDYGSIEGYVTDSVTGFGVQGANVIVILGGPPRVATTGAGGYYKLSSLLAGSGYPMQVQAANFTTWSGTVNVGVNQTTRKDVVLAAKTGTSGVLMGHVYGHGGAPLVGVGLEVSGKSVVSEAGGLYSIRLAPGAAYVYSSWPGYEPYLEEGLMVVAGDTTVHEVSLEPVDTDGDGLPDWIETSGCTDESEADSDGDGLCDGDTAVYDGATLVCSAGEDLDLDGEVGASETDPCDDDSDGDLLGDGDEALTYGTDPLEVDTDSDGLGDRLEAVVVSCLDPTDDDTDDDGLLDGTSSGEDKDGDGVVDATETSPCLFDTDTDTLGDGAEVTVYGTDPLEVDTDSDGLSDGLEVPWCTSPTDEDSDGDGLLDGTPSGEDKDGDGVVDATETNPCAFDSDSDGIGDGLELGTYGTNPLRQDTDSDGIGDYVEAVSSACLEATEADTDGDGLLDGTIFGEDKDGDGVVDPGETNPCLEDSDEDGLGDDEEPGLGLDPLEWDTDGDALPDGYEVANSSGHALNLDPLDPGDGCASDFDGDGNANCHEYYNGTDIWSENVTGGSACFSWADSGSTVSADGLVSPLDLGALNARASLKDASYTGVLPPNGDSQELDMDEIISALDLAVLRQMVANLSTSGNPSRPVALEVYGDTAVTAEVGSTVRIELGALNQGGKHTSSLGIIFTIDPSSTASATLLGGDGSASGGRYDVTGPIATGGRSAIVLLPTAPGALLLNAHLPPCGVDGKGRYCEELIKQPLVTVTVE